MRKAGASQSLAASIVCAACALALVAPSVAGAAEKAIWGPTQLPDGSNAFALYKRLGVDTYQVQLDWSLVAPAPPASPRDPDDPAYRWPANLSSIIREARRRGIRVAILVTRAPGWANGGREAIWMPRTSDFSAFLTAASRRYRSVRRWMIWGEPNRVDHFQPNSPNRPDAARAYARLLDAAYSGLKRVSGRNIVIGGMTWTGGDVKPAHFLRWLKLPSGRRPRLDWYGHNPFPFRYPRLSADALSGGWRDISDMDLFSREVARAFPGRPRLWLSEFTVQSDRRSNVFDLYVSKRQQARWLRAAYRIAERMRIVAGLGWIGLVDQQPAPGSSNWGLLTHDGKEKPALRAFRRALRSSRGASRASSWAFFNGLGEWQLNAFDSNSFDEMKLGTVARSQPGKQSVTHGGV